MKIDTGRSVIPRAHGAEGLATVEGMSVPRSGTLDEDMDATRFIRAIARTWIPISAITVICGIGSFVIASWTPSRYEASAMLVLAAPRGTPGLPRNAATARALLTNPVIVAEALRGTALEQSTTAPEFARTAILTDELPGGQFVRLRIRAPDPMLAATVARSLVDRAASQGARVDERAAADEGEQLKTQLNQAAERLTETGRLLLDYQHRSKVPGITGEVQTLLREQREELGLSAVGTDRTGPRAADAGPATPRGGRRDLTPAELKQLDTLSARELELARLRADYVVAGRIYSETRVRYEQARFDALSGGSLIRLVDPEILPGTPLPRGRVRKTMLGFVVGLLAALALVVAWEANKSTQPIAVQ